MSQSITLSDHLYHRLQSEAERHGYGSIEEFLERWALSDYDLTQRQEIVQTIWTLRQQIENRHGSAPDSTDLLRMDRAR